jgi:hypothetical protein
VLEGYFGTNPVRVQVEVTNGMVRMTGEIERKSMLPKSLRESAVWQTPDVVAASR